MIGSVLHHLFLRLRPVTTLAPAVTDPTERLGEGCSDGAEAPEILLVHDSIWIPEVCSRYWAHEWLRIVFPVTRSRSCYCLRRHRRNIRLWWKAKHILESSDTRSLLPSPTRDIFPIRSMLPDFIASVHRQILSTMERSTRVQWRWELCRCSVTCWWRGVFELHHEHGWWQAA